ncbi:MAG: hemerythrin domain-containing protein [Candidatus Thiodiazotropha sp. (ex Monitilora ramsayi)]|nr:hemerythrin domain-containing protein [Candidatus Thiodiazotropha sp. (ex Monitilora ramsayi)]
METIKDSMTQDHRRCDDIFVEMEQAIVQQQWPEADRLCREFIASMEHHFKIEEELLFPELEKAAPQAGGPVNVMTMEHDQMRHLMKQLASSVDKKSKELSTGYSDTLLVTMQQHNIKEESVLYPMADNAVPVLADEIAKAYAEPV